MKDTTHVIYLYVKYACQLIMSSNDCLAEHYYLFCREDLLLLYSRGFISKGVLMYLMRKLLNALHIAYHI